MNNQSFQGGLWNSTRPNISNETQNLLKGFLFYAPQILFLVALVLSITGTLAFLIFLVIRQKHMPYRQFKFHRIHKAL